MKLAPRAMKIGSIYNQLKIFLEMRKLAKRHNEEYDVLNPHNFPAILTTLKPHKPTVWMCNEPSPYFGKIEGYAVKKTEGIAVLDRMNFERIRKKYGRKSEIVWSGVDYGFFSKSNERKKGFTMLQIGTVNESKNHECSIRALSLVKKRIPEAKLVIAGREIPEYGMRMRKLAENLGVGKDIEFLGNVNEEKLRQLYGKSSLVLFPATAQSWGLTPLEAICAGTPSIVSNGCGVAYIITENEMGIVAKPDAQDFAKGIMEIYGLKRKERNKIIGNGKKFVRENMLWEHYAKRMLKLFEKHSGK